MSEVECRLPWQSWDGKVNSHLPYYDPFVIPLCSQQLRQVPPNKDDIALFLSSRKVYAMQLKTEQWGFGMPPGRGREDFRLCIGETHFDSHGPEIIIHELFHFMYRLRGGGIFSTPADRCIEELITNAAVTFVGSNDNASYARTLLEPLRETPGIFVRLS